MAETDSCSIDLLRQGSALTHCRSALLHSACQGCRPVRWDATETAERGAWQHSLSATHRALREDKRTVQNLQVLERHTHGNTNSAWVVLWPSNVEQTDHRRGELPGPILNNCQGVGIVAQWLVIPLVMPASHVGTVLVLAAP